MSALWLKQSTAVTVKLGPFVDSTDGVSAETALTISQADVRLSKNGGNMAQKNETTSAAHDELGYYDCLLDATDTGTLGRLRVMVSEAGALPVWADFMVVPAATYDAMVVIGIDEAIRTAIGMAEAHWDDWIAQLPVGDDMATAADFLATLNQQVIDGDITRAEFERISLAFQAGKTVGANTNNPRFLGQDGATERINAQMVNGDRTSVALDGSE